MNKKFNIKFSAVDKEKLPISIKLNDYLEEFIISNILKEKKIIVNAKYDLLLTMMLKKYTKGYETDEVVEIIKPRTISSENSKIYHFILPLNAIEESTCQISKLLDLIFEALKLFFLEYYKKVSIDFLNEVWKRLDIEYLMSIPYPAPPRDRKDVYTYYGY